MSLQRGPTLILTAVCVLILTTFGAPAARAPLGLGPATNYSAISGTGAPHIQLSNATISRNVGVANASGQLAIRSNDFVHGNVDFAGPVHAAPSPGKVSGTSTGSVNLTPAATAFQSLSTTSDTNATGAPTVNLTGGTTINVTSSLLIGNTYYFNIESVNLKSTPRCSMN